jgi:hypothetical protein
MVLVARFAADLDQILQEVTFSPRLKVGTFRAAFFRKAAE